ncbi:hypothetical protein [uncultured Imperialibacter sp.]|uniref:hypothetical protein n=1 Tax=uncultured Imperialibacter sp. TaxID=1672639 RepID=UPI0030D6F3C8
MNFRSIFSFFILLVVAQQSFAQDLFDYQHSKEYADYLFSAKRYPEAQREFERAVFFQPADTSAWWKLVRATQFSGDYKSSLKQIDGFIHQFGSPDKTISVSKFYSHIHLSQHEEARAVLVDNNKLESDDKRFLKLVSYALEDRWDQVVPNSVDSTASYPMKPLFELSVNFENEKMKSPFIAGAFSAIVPGTGKIYVGHWKDGLFSMLLFSTAAWQSYRGFAKSGVKSPIGWAFGGLATGFYLGNIYGSAKSAKKYNANKKEKYRTHVNSLLDIYYGIY